jgi:hypothetical protein
MRHVLAVALLASAFSSLHGQWRFSVKRDEMTDEQRAVFALRASTQTRNAAGLPTTPTLLLRCSGGRVTDLYVVQDAYVGDQNNVQLRWDTGTAYEELWSESTDHAALFAPEPDVFIDSLLLHRKLAFRFFPYGGTQQTAVFVLVSLAPQDVALRKHCGFSASSRGAAAAAQARRAAQEHKDKMVDIELAPLHDTIHVAEGEAVLARTLVKRVRNGRGVVLNSYELSFNIEYVLQARSMAFFGDTLPLESGINNVQVFVNGTQARRTLTYIVK